MALPIIAAGMIARYGAKKLAKRLVKRNVKKVTKPNISKERKLRESKRYGDPELNAKGNKAMYKEYKKHFKHSPDNHDFQSGMIKEGLPKKFFKKPMKTNKVTKTNPFDEY